MNEFTPEELEPYRHLLKEYAERKMEEEVMSYQKAKDGKHYWLTPDDLMAELEAEFEFDFDACPYPKPEDFDGLIDEWEGESIYVNPPFGSIIHDGKKKGPTAWARKALEEHKKGKQVIMVYPMDKWVLMLIEAGAEVRNLGDVKWCAIEDGKPGKGTGRHIAMFILGGRKLNNWISIEDRLPKRGKLVWVIADWQWAIGHVGIAVISRHNDLWYSEWGFGKEILFDVTHWQPLPVV